MLPDAQGMQKLYLELSNKGGAKMQPLQHYLPFMQDSAPGMRNPLLSDNLK